jgi:RNA polymerase sigma factor (sigma-70 family)
MAEESAQSTWSQVWRKLRSVRKPDRLRPWVVSIAFNEAKQTLRRARRHSSRTAPELTFDVPGGVDPATGISGIDLHLALRDLDPVDRALLTLRYVFGFDATELSTALGMTPSGVRSRLERLLARLRRELS